MRPLRSILSFRSNPALRPAHLAPLLLLSAACGGEVEAPDALDPAAVEEASRTGLDGAFAAAAESLGVPQVLLKAIAYVETRWYMVPGVPSEFEGQAAAYGVMALRGEALARGARLAGLPEELVRTQPAANVRAGAALLRAAADELGLDAAARARLPAWARAVARQSDIGNPDARAQYVHEVYRVLREGVPDGERTALRATLPPSPEAVPDHPPPSAAWLGGPLALRAFRYGGAVWRPAPPSNFTRGRSAPVSLVVVHTCAGGYAGCVSWLTTPYPRNPYQTSAHYVVSESGGEISQLVDESDTAHHVGAWWNGAPTNPRSIGIEHGGFPYAGSNRWTEGQIATSVRLACDIVRRHNIIRDRQHIIGHYQPDPVNRPNDPGRDFPWADYMNRINECLGGGGGGDGTITIDSNPANNPPNAVVDVDAASDAWVASTNVAGYWGTGYWVAPTAPVSDPMTFRFHLPAPATKTVYAWWTAASDRATAAPFVVFDGAGRRLGTIFKNQQVDGGRWNVIGTFNFSAGWNRVSISRWTAAGAYVVADAVQVR